MAIAPSNPDSTAQPADHLACPWQGRWLGGLGLIAIALCTWLPRSYFYMVAWPQILIWQVGFLAILLWLVWMLRQFKKPVQGLGYGLDKAVFAVALSLLLSSLFAQHRTVALWNCLLVTCYGALLYVLNNWIKGFSGLSHRRLWTGLVIVAAGTSLVSLAYWHPEPAMWLSDNFYDAIRNPWPLGHHNFTGGYFVLVTPIVISFALGHKGWPRRLAALASVLCSTALYASGSRGAWLGAIAALFGSLGVALWHSSGTNRRRLVVLSLLSLGVTVGLLFSNPRIRSLVLPQNSPVETQPNFVTVIDGPAQDRILMAKAAVNILKDRPLLGVGPGNLSRVYTRYRSIETYSSLVETPQLHNMPLQIFGELGLLGLAAYGFLLTCLLRLGYRLWHALTEPTDRALLYGIGASFWGYSVSSLTDSQLENIGISSTITIAIVLLLGLSETTLKAEKEEIGIRVRPNGLSKRTRTSLSRILLVFITLSFSLWIPADAAMTLANQGLQAGHQGNFIEADAKLSRAAQLASWDPTYNALAAQNLLKLYDQAEEVDRAPLLEQAIAYYKAALVAAPRDVWFNHNLGVLSLEANQPEQAEKYASQSIQVLPRHQNYTYYLLGLSYWNQEKAQEAATAFSLEALINPAFMSAQVWTTSPLASVRPAVMRQLNGYYADLMQTLPDDHPYQQWLCEQSAISNWWYTQGSSAVNDDCLHPLAQILMLADTAPDQAAQLIQQQLQIYPEDDRLKLMRAWLKPERYLDTYLSTNDLTQEEKTVVREAVYSNREIISWLSSSYHPLPVTGRRATILSYRNLLANQASLLLRPIDLEFSTLGRNFGLFSPSPRYFPELDRLLEDIRARKLGISHPTLQAILSSAPV